jgi:hypothetical protein
VVISLSIARVPVAEINPMKRFRCILANAIATLSLILCIAVLGLWVRSYYFRDILSWTPGPASTHVTQSIRGAVHDLTTFGTVAQGSMQYQSDRLSPQAIWNGGMSSYPVEPEWHLGFIYQYYTRVRMAVYMTERSNSTRLFTTSHRLIVIPYWFPALLFALCPFWRLISRIRKREDGVSGRCRKCGYDLRATPDRCPECGTRNA